jgi:hypothetical protein
MPLDGLNIEVSNQRGPAVFAITPQSAALRSGKIEMPMPSLRRIARFVLGSFFRPSERVELLADASEVSAKAEPGESVRPFSHPKDAPELFWVRLRIDYPSWGPVHVHPTSTLNAKASAGDYVITLCDDGSTTLTLSAGPPPQAEMILQEHGLHPEDRQRHYWAQSPPLQPWSAKQLIALIGALHGFTRVDSHFWTRLRGEEVDEEEEPIKPVSESKVRMPFSASGSRSM